MKEALKRFAVVRKDPWEFLKCVKTKDEVDRKNPIKHFPVHLKYLQLYTRIWQREMLMVVPKSRRMKMSWINICLFLHDAMFNVGRNYAFVSKKEDDADDLIKRAIFVLRNLDKKRLPKDFVPKWEHKFCYLGFPGLDSQIRGFPQGADQLRQFTFTGILADEMAFWEKAEDMYSASLPTLEGGGRFTAISSPGPGFFKRLVFDQLDRSDDD